MGTTRRYGLETFGGEITGSFTDKGSKYTLADRQTIDSVLAALEAHDHIGGTRLMDPAAPPSLLTAVNVAGRLLSGISYYYRIGYLDKYGLETAASNEVSITVAPGLNTPPAPVLIPSDAGGGLTPGQYWYGVAQYGADEYAATAVSQAMAYTLTVPHDTITVQPAPLEGDAGGFVVYRKAPGQNTLYKVAAVAAPATQWVDNGTVAADYTRPASYADTIASNNQVMVSLPTADVVNVTCATTAITEIAGGTLAAGTYQYILRPELTYLDPVTNADKTVYGTQITFSKTTTGTGKSVQVTATCTAETALRGFLRLYGRLGGTKTLVAEVPLPGPNMSATLTDTGAAGTTTYVGSSITYKRPRPEIVAWRIYRTSTSGYYGSNSMVQEVRTTIAGDEGGDLAQYWIDLGLEVYAGAPLGTSTTFQPPAGNYLSEARANTLYAIIGRLISTGTGLTGGGDLSANRTLALDLTYADGRYVQASQVILPISAATTLAAAPKTNYVYVCTGATAFTVTLPTAVGNTSLYVIKRVGTGNITIATTSGQTFDGGAAPILGTQWQSVTVISDGANWIKIAAV